MPRLIHPLAGVVALLTIATFWLSTVISELFLSRDVVIAVKITIPWGFLLLVPALAATGGSGVFLSQGQRTGLVGTKLRRMPFIAANGILILIPSAMFLAARARAGLFDASFYGVQALELLAGATNITLLGLNFRDGLKLTQWRRKNRLKPAQRYRTILEKKEDVADGTVAFFLKKPEGFTFTAGQAVYVTLPELHKSDSTGRIRTFSLAGAPTDSTLLVATRLRDSAFKHCLAGLPEGSVIDIEGPYGDLAVTQDTRPVVFIAGGIGITPFRSMILDSIQRGLTRYMTLFYSNRDEREAAFLSELQQLSAAHPHFRLVATMTRQPDWQGEQGYITQAMLSRHLDDLTGAVFYLAGPPVMVAAMQTLLKQTDVHPAQIHSESFAGY